MTDQRSRLSTWLLQMFGPLWLLSSLILFTHLFSTENGLERHAIGSFSLFMGFYGAFQFGTVLLDTSNIQMSVSRRLWGLVIGFGFPASLGIVQHPHATEAGLWQELIVPMLVTIWIGFSAFHMQVSTATLECRVRPLVALPISGAAVLLAIEACLQHQSLMLNAVICIYTLPICVVALRDYLATSSDSAPS